MELTKEQEIVVSLSAGIHLVLAPPGTGKTDILSQRIQIALQNGVQPEKMLCLTFTNRASKEMNKRIEDRFGKTGVFIGNIHTFCLTFLKEKFIINNASLLLDEDEAKNILNESISSYIDDLIKSSLINTNDLTKFRHQLQKVFSDIKPYNLSQIISYLSYKEHYQLPDEVCYVELQKTQDQILKGIEPTFDNSYSITTQNHLREVARLYVKNKKEVNGIDFDDLLALSFKYLITNCHNENLYEWIQIDEVQDLNPLQWKIIEMISNENTHRVYFGDYEQAIYSFLGAKLSNLQTLEEVATLHTFSLNFRSPAYLLNLFVYFAKHFLKPKWKKDPIPFSDEKPDKISLCFREIGGTPYYENLYIVTKVLKNLPKDEVKAILLRTNKQADEIAEVMQSENLEFFKISGFDVFKYAIVKTTLAVMSVFNDQYSRASWIRIFYELTNLTTLKEARNFVVTSFSLGFTPKDIILDSLSVLEDFHTSLKRDRIIVFDTETTGLDTEDDDIIQIAGIEIINGKVEKLFEVFMNTAKSLEDSEKIHGISREHLDQFAISPQEGLQKFLDFVGDDIVVAHNLPYDYAIMKSNLRRYNLSFSSNITFFDSLDFAKRLYPDLPKYKLGYLLERLKIEGVNSHNALDDVKATANLLFKLFENNDHLFEKRSEFIESHKSVFKSSQKKLFFIYSDLEKFLYTTSALSFLFNKVLQYCLLEGKFVNPEDVKKITAHMDFHLQVDNLKKLLEENINNYSTYKETDLVTGNEKIIVSTVHKAKGLQFTNVIMPNCINGNYPFTFSKDHSEDARLFYVGMSRSRKRLIFTSCSDNEYRPKMVDNVLTYDQNELSDFTQYLMRLLDYKFIDVKTENQ
uniref:UvrD-helicase domain-containing protein n=1 Tax=Chryseobacterium sp. TaxID=1871047 RepID=UPI0015979177|nr:ATP-dependent helicase [Chryseobacterium sp.]QJS06480.1 ATP-dependent UvrD/REP helicase [Chryseobacterium sp.]